MHLQRISWMSKYFKLKNFKLKMNHGITKQYFLRIQDKVRVKNVEYNSNIKDDLWMCVHVCVF